jgi:hypothetical protein
VECRREMAAEDLERFDWRPEPVVQKSNALEALLKRVRPIPQEKKRPEPKCAGGMLSMAQFARNIVKQDRKKVADKLRKSAVYMKHEYPMMEKLRVKECQGDIRVRRQLEALAYIDKVMFRRSKQQKQMHHAMLLLSLESYYGTELNENLVRLLKKYKISEIRNEGLFMAPRRFGKTIGGGMYVGCELVTQPGDKTNYMGHDVLVYSNNQRASSLFLMVTFRVVMALLENENFGGTLAALEKRGSMTIKTREGFTNIMTALPADEDRLRGVGSRAVSSTVIGEEIGYMPPGIVFKIIAPILTRRRVKFVGITTVKNSSDSFLMPMAEAKYPDGRSIMLVLNFDLVCDDCKKRGLALQCKCLSSEIPPWQSAARHDKLTHLMKNDPQAMLTELKNVPVDQLVDRAFKFEAVDWLRTEEAILQARDVYSPVIYTTVDPACGGQYSRFAIISCIFYSGCFVVSWFLYVFQQLSFYVCDVFFDCSFVSCSIQGAQALIERNHTTRLHRRVVGPPPKASGQQWIFDRNRRSHRRKEEKAGEKELLRHRHVIGEASDKRALQQSVNPLVELQHAKISVAALIHIGVLNDFLHPPHQLCAMLKAPRAIKKHRADLSLSKRTIGHVDFDREHAESHVVPNLVFALAIRAPGKRRSHRRSVVAASVHGFVHFSFSFYRHQWLE